MRDCIDLFQHFEEVLVLFAYRSVNGAAHPLARAYRQKKKKQIHSLSIFIFVFLNQDFSLIVKFRNKIKAIILITLFNKKLNKFHPNMNKIILYLIYECL